MCVCVCVQVLWGLLPLPTPGQKTQHTKSRLGEKFSEAILCQPSVILLDDLDHAAPMTPEGQQDGTGEGILSSKRTQSKSLSPFLSHSPTSLSHPSSSSHLLLSPLLPSPPHPLTPPSGNYKTSSPAFILMSSQRLIFQFLLSI